MKNSDSYEHIETKYWDKENHLIVSSQFKGTNSFGAVVKTTIMAKTDLKGHVIEILFQGE